MGGVGTGGVDIGGVETGGATIRAGVLESRPVSYRAPDSEDEGWEARR